MDEIIINYQGTLYVLIPDLESQRWNTGILDAASYVGMWWQMDAIDSDGNEYMLCWFEENIEEDENGMFDANLYKPDFLQCTYSIQD